MAATNKIPAFFKFFDPEFNMSSQRLNIPLSFTLYMKGVVPDKALLRDKHGNLWPLKVVKISNEHFFEEGWVKFIADTGLSRGDSLVFQYDGGNIFDFKLLGPNGCEKEYAATCSIKIKEEREEKEKEVSENADKEVKEDEIEVEEVGEEDFDSDVVEIGEEDFKSAVMEVEEEDDEDDDSFTMDEYSDEELEEEENDDSDENYEPEEDIRIQMNASKKEAETSGVGVHAKRVVTSTRGNDGKAVVRTVAGRKNTDAGELEKISKDLSRLGLLPSVAPYFISSQRTRNRNELHIPPNLIRDHDLNIPEKMIIRAEDGTEFISRITTWGDGRKIVTDGWRAFCRWYYVKKDEKCCCVFMPDNKLQIYVLQLQAGKWMSRPRL